MKASLYKASNAIDQQEEVPETELLVEEPASEVAASQA